MIISTSKILLMVKRLYAPPPPSFICIRISLNFVCTAHLLTMSVRRVKWEANEKLQLKRLFRSHPLKPASYIENLFNAGKPKYQHRSLNAVKFRVSSLKKEWYRRWLKERSKWSYRSTKAVTDVLRRRHCAHGACIIHNIAIQ